MTEYHDVGVAHWLIGWLYLIFPSPVKEIWGLGFFVLSVLYFCVEPSNKEKI